MTDSAHDAGLRAMVTFDALLPPHMAERAEETGARKATLDFPALAALSILAGAFIALGAVFFTVALAGAGDQPPGSVRMFAGVAFSLGLVLVVVGGGELFTGNSLIVMAWAARRIPVRAVARNWAITYAGNFAGAVATAGLVVAAETYRVGDMGEVALRVAASKLDLGFGQAVALGILGNGLVCLAVWLTYSARSTADRVLVVVLPVAAFVAAGFEHSIANMYFIPFAILLAWLDPAFVAAHGGERIHETLTWGRFVFGNLLPVTLGNLIGGVGLVGAVYWFVYLRHRQAL
jgi:formate/nitrite transporter